jgi:cell division protein FtsL
MSTFADTARPARRSRGRAKATRSRLLRRPYITINGATMVSIAAIVITVIGLLYLIQTSQVAQLGYDMSRLQTEREQLSLDVSELKYEFARYESLYTVEQVATEQLGMVHLTNYDFIEVEAPVHRELPVAQPVSGEDRTLFGRVVRSMLGIGEASSKSTDPNQRLVR